MTTDKSVYLDHAATTPMHPAAIEAMTAVLATVGNASSLHGTGRVARRRMEESRETLATLLGGRAATPNPAVGASSPPRSNTMQYSTPSNGWPNTKAPR
jgi:selenocysteine lyase/cysteine desulfurase